MPYRCFHAIATGGNHRMHGLGCEDASGSRQLLPGNAFVAAVADGHGDDSCTRSDIGAHFAVTTALEHLTRVYECDVTLKDNLIAKDIVQKWRSLVSKHYYGNPSSSDELVTNSAILDEHSLYHLYGTTLVAMLKTPSFLLLLQQGDGCCLLLDDNGSYHRPLPEDPHCVGNKTSSMADVDAAVNMRVRVLRDCSERLAACFLGSDGIDKSFADDDGLFAFCDWVMLKSTQVNGDDLGKLLDDEFERLGMLGGNDDMSFAGIICDVLPDSLITCIQSRFEQHEMQRSLLGAKSKLVSMTRKHQKLEELWRKNDPMALKEYPRYHAEYLSLQQRVAMIEHRLGN